MMKRILGVVALVAIGLAAEAEEVKVKVTGGRVNIRSRASLSGELMGQVMVNDELILTGETNGEFVAVFAPEWVECWVAREFLQDGIVVPPKLNVRAGANMNYGVVAVANRGDKLEVVREMNDWLKVKAPTNAVAWISSEFVAPLVPEKTEQPKPKIFIQHLATEVDPTNAVAVAVAEPVAVKPVEPKLVAVKPVEPTLVEPKVVEPQPKAIGPDMASEYAAMVAETEPKIMERPSEPKLGPAIPIVFEPNRDFEQGGEYKVAGTLRASRSIQLYRLVDEEGATVCFVKGESEQMRKLLGRSMRVEGKSYFYKRMELPVVVPSRLVLRK
jgi:hypothetical protein